MSYVYLFGAAGTQAVKIGKASNVKSRLSCCQVGSPLPLVLLWHEQVVNAERVEVQLHHHFRDKRVRGEWFDLGPDPVSVVREAFDILYDVPEITRNEPEISPIPPEFIPDVSTLTSREKLLLIRAIMELKDAS